MNRKYNINNHGWLVQINGLLPMVNKLHNLQSDKNVDKFKSLVFSLLYNKGEKYTIERLKSFRLALQQFALKQAITPIPFCKTDKDGFPKALRFLKPDLNDVYNVRYSFSVMRIIESFRCKPDYSVSTITNKFSGSEELVNEISNYIHKWPIAKAMPKLGHSRLILSNRAGPNGPSTISCLKDLVALKLREPTVFTAVSIMLGKYFPYINMTDYKIPKSPGNKLTGKLVLLSDKACKTRVIAIADWWSNVALSNIHDAAMETLTRLPGDVTYRQNQIPRLVKNLGDDLYSSDMTAFTDRFPRKLEIALLTAAYGPKISKLWELITTYRKFHHPKGEVVYEVGNPMGVLSSWPVSTLTHHAVKQWCAHKCGKTKYKYLILGDDTLDTCEKVYNKYIKTINALGVSISHAKSTKSRIGNTEFAKRLFINHVEVTGLPVHLLANAHIYPEQILEFVKIARERGYEDKFLGPSLNLYLNSHNQRKMILDMLSLPESILGMPPLMEVTPGSWAEQLFSFKQEDQDAIVTISRNYVFWNKATDLNMISDLEIVNTGKLLDGTHPLAQALVIQLDAYLSHKGEGEYSIYDSWMQGDYREMVNLPSQDTYKYFNRGHKDTRSKYEVLQAVLQVANGNCNISLTKVTKLSNFELYNLAITGIFGKEFQIPMQPD